MKAHMDAAGPSPVPELEQGWLFWAVQRHLAVLTPHARSSGWQL